MSKKQLSHVKTANSIPIAMVKGGENNNQIIYLSDEMGNSELKINDLFDHVKEKKVKQGKKHMTFQEMMSIRNAFEYGDPIDDKYLKDIYDKLEPEVSNSVRSKITVHDGIIRPLPHITDTSEESAEQNDRVMISGASGSGKTTWIRKYIKKYVKLYPTNAIYLFAAKPKDKKIDDLTYIKRIPINEELYNLKMNYDNFRDSLIIFDDTDTIIDEKMNKHVQSIRDNLMQNGRAYGISIIAVAHVLCNAKKTQTLHTECNKIVLYTRIGSYQIQRYLKEYCGISPDNIKKINSIKSPWVMINKATCPYIAVSEHEIFIL
jgi:hypothetical protein